MPDISLLPTKTQNLIEVDANQCWIWQGKTNIQGYGMTGNTTAHRSVYRRLVGEVPKELELDHLCRVTRCVNPDHLDPVTPEENRRRKYDSITECKRGHHYDRVNTYVRPNGQRDCRQCIRDRVRRYKREKRAAA